MITKVGDWSKLERLLTVPLMTETVERYSSIAIKRSGLLLERRIKAGMRSVGSPPNSPITIQRKGSSKPWIDEGDLWRSVTSIAMSPLVVWVGVPEGVSSRNTGVSLAKIARILEGGEVGSPPVDTIIKVKNAKSLFIPLRRNVRPKDPGLVHGEDFILAKTVRIRARPVIGPAVKGSSVEIAKMIEDAIAKAFRSLLGIK